MALANSIGDFSFLDLTGEIALPQQESEILQRPGVDGTGFKRIGRRGRPFQLRSIVDAPTLDDAHEFGRLYALIANDGSTYNLIFRGTDYANAGVAAVVLAVSTSHVATRILFKGGLNPPSLGWIAADWTLILVNV